jgi:hypothetical protein
MNEPARGTERWRQNTALVALEFVVIAGVYFADWTHHIYLSKIP